MARAFSLALRSYLSGQVIALANCIRIVRLDGQQFGFTALDMDVTIEGQLYSAYTSVDASELASQVGSGVDNMSVIGLLSSSRITEAGLLAGIWDAAKIELFFWPFDNPSLGKITLLSGTIGEITEDGGQFTAEVRGLSQRLSQQFVELTSPLCRVRALGDARCMPKGFNEGTNISVPTGTITMAGIRFTRTVTAVGLTVLNEQQITFGGSAEASTIFRHSPLRFLTGACAGLTREVKEHTAGGGSTAVLVMQEKFPLVVAIGDTATLEWGCDRTFSQCGTLFGNSTNYQGCPHLPGNDAILKRGARA